MGDRSRVAQAGECRFVPPTPEPFLNPSALVGIAESQQPVERFQVGPQPLYGLLSPADQFAAIQLTCVDSSAGSGLGRCARACVAMAEFQAVGRSRVGSYRLGKQAGGSDVAPLLVTELGILESLVGARKLHFTREDRGQPAIEFDPPPAFSHPLARRIAPILTPGAQFVPALQGDESLGEFPLFPKHDAEIAVTLRVIGVQFDGLAVGRQCLVESPRLRKENAKAVVGVA